MNELVRLGSGNTPVPRFGTQLEKQTARTANEIVSEVRLSALRAEGQIALAGHIMNNLTELNAHKRMLAQDDPGLHMMLSRIEAEAGEACTRLQKNLFNDSPFLF